MSIIHGSMGIGYFCHQFRPASDEAAPLHDAETKCALAGINAQVTSLARVLNTRSIANAVAVTSSNAAVPVDTMAKRTADGLYVFAMGGRNGETTATFRLGGTGNARVEVLGEGRTLAVKDGAFEDRFGDYEVHLYKVR
jgi:hypothetical protein